MNPFFKTIIFISVIGFQPALLCMDEQPKTQAELDAIQFAKEQETKKLAASANKQAKEQQRKRIEDGLKVSLKDARIKGKPFNTDVIEVLPADVQKEIVKFAYSPTAFSEGYQLLPALIPHCLYPFKPNPETSHKTIVAYKKKFSVAVYPEANYYATTLYDRIKRRHEYRVHIKTINALKTQTGCEADFNHDYWGNFFTSRVIPRVDFGAMLVNDTLYLSKSSAKDTLENCSMEQLDLIRKLWTSDNDKCKRAWQAADRQLSKNIMNQPIKLSSQETKVFESLPEQMRFNLESNYRIQLDRTRYAKAALVGLGCAALIGAVWKLKGKPA